VSFALYINGELADVEEGAEIGLSYNIASVRSPAERTSGFSTTITCPFTPNNRRLFGHLETVAVTGRAFGSTQVDRTQPQPARIEAQGLVVFEGTCIVERITRSGFEVYLSGNDVPWQSALDRPLRELLSADYAFDLVWEQDTIAPYSYGDGNRAIDKFIVPVVDYGNVAASGEFNFGIIRLDKLCPALFVKQLLRMMFRSVGFNQGNDYFDLTDANSLLLYVSEFNHHDTGEPVAINDLFNGLSLLPEDVTGLELISQLWHLFTK